MSATSYVTGKPAKPMLRIAIPSFRFTRRAARRAEKVVKPATREELQQLFGTELSKSSRRRLSNVDRFELQKNADLRKALYDND